MIRQVQFPNQRPKLVSILLSKLLAIRGVCFADNQIQRLGMLLRDRLHRLYRVFDSFARTEQAQRGNNGSSLEPQLSLEMAARETLDHGHPMRNMDDGI